VRRAFRILPVFVVVLALYFLWPSFREYGGIQPLWQFLTFTMNLLIDYGQNKAFSHAWSLCVEEHFYLLFPVLAWWMTRRPSAMKFIVVSACVVLGGMFLRSWIWTHELAPVMLSDDGRFDLSKISTSPPGLDWMACLPAWCWRRSKPTAHRCGKNCNSAPTWPRWLAWLLPPPRSPFSRIVRDGWPRCSAIRCCRWVLPAW
jgi:peptidoglycan/LPS O-acetylase OafA/YrhL